MFASNGEISPTLANLTLDGMQEAIRQAAHRRGDKVNFVRYADDFIVTGANREILEQKVQPALTAFLAQRGLELSEQKTVITATEKGFNFLGHTVRKFGDTLLTRPAKSSVQALRDKIRLCFQSALGLSQEALIRKLNPVLRGWANYHRNGAAKRTFDHLDYYVFRKLWRWAKRRHPTKSAAWRKHKYFSATGKEWAFSVPIRLAEGKSHVLKLYQMASTRIERHIKSKGQPTPTTHSTLITSPSAVALPGAQGPRRLPRRQSHPAPRRRSNLTRVQTCRRAPTPWRAGLRGLSRMKGNFQVRFLEGGGLATARLHSAQGKASGFGLAASDGGASLG